MSNGANCDKCGAVRVPIYDREKADGSIKGWRCPNGKRDGSGCQGKTLWLSPFGGAHPQAPLRPQGPPSRLLAPPQAQGSRDRSIEAQACCKAACEMVGTIFNGQGSACEREATEMVIRVAKRLMREVVLAAPVFQPDYQPASPNAFAFTEDQQPPPHEDADIPF